MSPQQKTSGGGGGRKSAKGGTAAAGQKDSVAVDQNNGQNSTNNKKHNNNTSSTNSNVNNNNNNTDQVKTEKEKPHVKPTAEQIRIAQITEIKSGTQDPTREKVIQLMEATERSEEDACLALYECDNDLDRAVIYLIENLEIGALITTTKKKKNKAAVDGEGDEFESSNNRDSARDGGAHERSKGGRSSNRGGASNRGRSRPSGEYRGGAPRDNNNDERTKGSGPRRGGFSSRGRGGRMGPRGRDPNSHRNNNNFRSQDHQEIDNWDPSATQNDNKIFGQEEASTWGDCGDWDNEEYTGSLSDTKVFTPSTQQDLAAPPGLEQQILNPPTADVSQYPSVVSNSGNAGQYGDLHSTSNTLRQALEIGQQQSAQLSAEQSQYFNTLGSQNNNSAYQSSVQYQYNDQVVSNSQAPRSHQQQQQQQQQRSRARVPPPSKIPSSAVEMPSDVDLPVYLDVQFGGLDFGSGTEDPSYETEKYSQGIDQSTGDDYSGGNKNSSVSKSSQSALGGLQSSQLLQNADSISSSTQADLSNSYAQRNTSIGGAGTGLDQLTKTGDIYSSSGGGNNTYQNLSTYQTTQKSGGYQTTGYGSNAYNSTQSTTNNYPASSNAYGYNQNSYQQNQGTQSGNAGQPQTQTSGTGVSSNSANPNQPINSNTAGYMSNQYPAQSGFQQNSYQSQSVYGNSNNLNSNTDRFSGSINSLTSKLKTQGTFESSTNAVSSGTASTSSNTAITTSSINSSSLGLNSAKSTTSASTLKTGASQATSSATSATINNNASSTGIGAGTNANTGNGASNVVQNIPLVSSYIQPAFYQQQPYLHFEDMQLVQPRMTPMTGYYEYQTPTSLAGVRGDGTASNLASVAYPTMSTDARFARTDNSSPVQSQQTGSSQLMNALPPYAYFYGTNVMPGGFQQFPQIYSQMPATNPNATQFAKQSAYSSGYGSTGYESTAPEYNKTTYQSTAQQTKGHTTTNQSGTNSDIASSMYNKSHVTLNKVNSYDKQSFHSGTPPPFNLNSQAGSQTQAAYQQHLYLQPMAPHHNINMHQPIHQMEGGRITNSRRDTNSSGQRQQSGNQSKSGSKPGYSSTYWNTQN